MSSPLLPVLIASALLVACDETETPPSRSDAGDAPADVAQDAFKDVSRDVIHDRPADAPADHTADQTVTDEGTPVDQGSDLAAVEVPAQPAGCPAAAPTGGTACSLAESIQCKYQKSPCQDGKPLERLCTCTNGAWSCIQDLGCPDSGPVGGPPEQRCGACLPAGASTCTYTIEKCVAAENLSTTCTCAGGNAWSCTRQNDCYPPNTCRPANGRDDCVTNGLVNTGPFCPPGYLQDACRNKPCTPGDVRLTCLPPPGQRERSAACVYGQWACPIGYYFPFPL